MKIDMTPQEARAWLRKILGPDKRKLEGQEREQMLLVFALMDPYQESNNQRFWNSMYRVGDRVFSVTSGTELDEDIVEEILEYVEQDQNKESKE